MSLGAPPRSAHSPGRGRAGGRVGLVAGAIACLWIALLLVTTAGRSFNSGPWRVQVVALAALIGLGFCGARASGVLRLSLDPASDTAAARAVGVLTLGSLLWTGSHSPVLAAGPGLLVLAASSLAVVWLALSPAGDRSGGGVRWVPALAWWGCAAVAAWVHLSSIAAQPIPPIDVLDHLRRAAETLLAGVNPYAQAVPDFYRGQSIYGFDTPGFPYPPAVLALAVLAGSLGLEVRWLLLACALAAAALTRAVALRSGWSPRVASLLGILALAVPRQSYLLTSGYSEPLSGLLLLAAVWLWLVDRRAASFGVLGLFLTSKQYLLVAAPLLLLACASASQFLWLAAGATVLWLPFAAWGPLALWHAAFGIHLARPPRPDGLTWNAWRMASGGDALASWVPLASGLATALLAGIPRPATPASLCLGLAGVLTLTLFLSPQAFSNYYLLTSWALIAAVACLPARAECDE